MVCCQFLGYQHATAMPPRGRQSASWWSPFCAGCTARCVRRRVAAPAKHPSGRGGWRRITRPSHSVGACAGAVAASSSGRDAATSPRHLPSGQPLVISDPERRGAGPRGGLPVPWGDPPTPPVACHGNRLCFNPRRHPWRPPRRGVRPLRRWRVHPRAVAVQPGGDARRPLPPSSRRRRVCDGRGGRRACCAARPVGRAVASIAATAPLGGCRQRWRQWRRRGQCQRRWDGGCSVLNGFLRH